MTDRPGGRSGLTRRILAYYTLGYLVLVGLLGVIVDRSLRLRIGLAALAIGLLGAGLVILLGRRLSGKITSLAAQALAISENGPVAIPKRSSVRELDELGLAVAGLARRLRRRLTEEERASRTLEVVLGALPQGTVLISGDDKVVYANPSSYALLGGVPDELQGLSPYQFQGAVREARKRREPETRVVDHGRPVRRLRGVATPFAEDDRVLLVVVDITERERADAIRRDFVANASHELKTPVSTIVASAEALQIAAERGDPSAASFAREIEESARRLDRLVTDLLDLSRLERETPELSPVRLDRLIEEEVRRLTPMTREKGITMEVTLTPAMVAGSLRDLTIAAGNLLENAIRYTDEGGTIVITVSAEDAQAVLTVADNGEGIPIRDLDRVFERFYRVDSARSRDTGGTGLGLAIVKHVAESHGGSVEVRSQLGVGSTFTFRIPLADSGEASGSH